MPATMPLGEFYGCVIFRNYITPPWLGAKIAGVTGKCSIRPAEEVMGFKPNVRDSNWMILVQGNKVTMGVPGCEVLNVQAIEGPFPVDLNDEIVEVP